MFKNTKQSIVTKSLFSTKKDDTENPGGLIFSHPGLVFTKKINFCMKFTCYTYVQVSLTTQKTNSTYKFNNGDHSVN